ncbi:hypothetical protein L873DRAFT_914581 [Choiromyces venosus 120613-1]|uniref:Uncharacterized protein n=1 Tax=Choiromyces venosus 120613-1 TaxID=1336337 RepID=A0A3N4JT02_9PEZI|nr:hypothetical protein L873DRAFT_914581 [Choiromyces venosus 120613-1]
MEEWFRVMEKIFDTKFTGFGDHFNDKLGSVESRFNSSFNRIENRFDNIEKWFRYVIAFGVSVVGASLGTVILKALYYDKQVKDEMLASMKEMVENAAARTESKVLLAQKHAIIGGHREPEAPKKLW